MKSEVFMNYQDEINDKMRAIMIRSGGRGRRRLRVELCGFVVAPLVARGALRERGTYYVRRLRLEVFIYGRPSSPESCTSAFRWLA